MYRFKGFTEKANTALNLAIEAAQELGHTYIGTEHIVLGLLREGTGVAASVLGARGVTAALYEEKIVEVESSGEFRPADAEDFTPGPNRHGNGAWLSGDDAAWLCGDGAHPHGGAAGRQQRGRAPDCALGARRTNCSGILRKPWAPPRRKRPPVANGSGKSLRLRAAGKPRRSISSVGI